jgi:thymidylate kinase
VILRIVGGLLRNGWGAKTLSLILLEGCDGTQKSSTIRALKEKHGFSSFAFPTPNTIDKLRSFKTCNTESTLTYYHMIFEMDFAANLSTLDSLLKKGKHVLLDRYFISNLAYASINFHNKYHLSSSKFLQVLHNIDHQIVPDLVIFLRLSDPHLFKPKQDSLFTQSELQKLQERYADILTMLQEQGKIKDYDTVTIESEKDRPKVLSVVESILKERGFI